MAWFGRESSYAWLLSISICIDFSVIQPFGTSEGETRYMINEGRNVRSVK